MSNFKKYEYKPEESVKNKRKKKTVVNKKALGIGIAILLAIAVGLGAFFLILRQREVSVDYMVGESLIGTTQVQYFSRLDYFPTESGVEGYDIDGWYKDPELTKPFNHKSLIWRATTLYAKLKIREYNVLYDLNGGVGDIPKGVVKHGDDIFLSTIQPVREGMTFVGWSTEPISAVNPDSMYDGLNAADYIAENKVTSLKTVKSTKTVYAIWRLNKYTLTYIVDGVQYPTSVVYSTTNPLGDLSSMDTDVEFMLGMGGKVFTGWTTTQGSSIVEYEMGQSYTYNFARDITVYGISKQATNTDLFTFYFTQVAGKYYATITGLNDKYSFDAEKGGFVAIEGTGEDEYEVIIPFNGELIIPYSVKRSDDEFAVITGINTTVFKEADYITTLEIYSSQLNFIMQTAFEGSSLEKIYLGKGISSANLNTVFKNLEKLTEIKVSPLNSGYTSIDGVLYLLQAGTRNPHALIVYPYAKANKIFTLPATVQSIMDLVLHEIQALEEVYVESGNNQFASDSYGFLYNKTMTSLLLIPKNSKKITYAAPTTLVSIGTRALDIPNTSLKAINLCAASGVSPNNIVSIIDNGNISLLNLPETFEYMYVSSDRYEQYTSRYTWLEFTKGMAEDLFTVSGTTITLRADKEFSSVENSVYYIEWIRGIKVTGIGASASSDSIKEVTKVYIPSSVSSIANGAFVNFDKLAEIDLTDNASFLWSGALFAYTEAENVFDLLYIPKGVDSWEIGIVLPEVPEEPETPVDPETPEEPEDPEDPIDPDEPEEPEEPEEPVEPRIRYIKSGAIVGLTGTEGTGTELIFTVSIEAIESGAISGIDTLTEIEFQYRVDLVKTNAISNCDALEEFTIQATVIEEGSLQNLESLTNVAISLYQIEGGIQAFLSNKFVKNAPAFATIDISNSNDNDETPEVEMLSAYFTVDNVVFKKLSEPYENSQGLQPGTMTLYMYPEGNKRTVYDAPATYNIHDSEFALVGVEDYAFINNRYLVRVNVGENIESLGNNSFDTAQSLLCIQMPSAKLYLVGTSVFGSSILNIQVPADKIDSYVYGGLLNTYSSKVSKIVDYASEVYNVELDGTVVKILSIVKEDYNDYTDLLYYEFAQPSGYFAGATKIEVAQGVFSAATRVTKLFVQTDVNFVGGSAAGAVALEAFVVDELHPKHIVENGILYDRGKTKIFDYPSNKTGAYTIPDTVTSIESKAFYKSKLTAITIPNTVISVGEYAFAESSLANLAFESRKRADSSFIALSLGQYAFYKSKLVDANIYNGNTSFGEGIFSGITTLKTVTFVDTSGAGATWPDKMFAGSSLTSIVIPSNVNSLGVSTFEGCISLKSINMPTVITIGDAIFKGCLALTTINAPFVTGTEVTPVPLKYSMFEGAISISEIYFDSIMISDIPLEEEDLEDKALFRDSTVGIKKLKLGDVTLTSSDVLELKLHKNIKNTLQILDLPDVSSWESTGVSFSVLETVYFESLTVLPKALFSGATKLQKVVFGRVYVADKSFDIVSIEVQEEDNWYIYETVNINGTTYYVNTVNKKMYLDKNRTQEITAINGKNIEVRAVAVITISDNSFLSCAQLSMVIPSTVTTLGSFAFSDNKGRATIVIPKGVTSYSIGARNPFAGCEAVEKFVQASGAVNTSLVFIDGIMFTDVSETEVELSIYPTNSSKTSFSVKGIIEGKKVVYIGNEAFYGVKNLQSIDIEGVTLIKQRAFSAAKKLQTVSSAHQLQEIGNSAFDKCSALYSFTDPVNVTKIGTAAFLDCTALKNIKLYSIIHGSDNNLGAGAFFYKINEINLVPRTDLSLLLYSEADVATFKSKAETDGDFMDHKNMVKSAGFTSLADLTYTIVTGATHDTGATIKSLVVNSTTLSTIVFPDYVKAESFFYKLTQISGQKIASPTNLKSVTSILLPTWLKTVGRYAFYDQAALESVAFPLGLEVIDVRAFEGCSKLAISTLPSTLKTIQQGAFTNIKGSKTITLPASLESFAEDAFMNIELVEEFVVDANNPKYISKFGVVYNKQKATYELPVVITGGTATTKEFIAEGVLLLYPTNKPDATFALPTSVSYILGNAFYGVKNLENLNISVATQYSGLNYIGARAFKEAKKLSSINLTTIIEIGFDAFANTVKLESVQLGKNINIIGAGAFSNAGSGVTGENKFFKVYMTRATTQTIKIYSTSFTAPTNNPNNLPFIFLTRTDYVNSIKNLDTSATLNGWEALRGLRNYIATGTI